MALAVLAVVVARYALQISSIAAQEFLVFFHASVFMLCASNALSHGAHVRIDVLYRNFTPTTQARIDLAGALLLLLPLSTLIFWLSWDFVLLSWQVREVSPNSPVPIYLLKTLLPLTAVALALGAVEQALKVWPQARGGALSG